MLYILYPLSFISSPISVRISPEPLAHILHKIPIIKITIFVNYYSFSIGHSLLPSSLVKEAALPNLHLIPVPQTIPMLTLINSVIFYLKGFSEFQITSLMLMTNLTEQRVSSLNPWEYSTHLALHFQYQKDQTIPSLFSVCIKN